MKKNGKKTILSLFICSTVASMASTGFVIVVDGENETYLSDTFSDITTYTSWGFARTESCNFDKLENEVYFEQQYSKTEICDNIEDRTKTVKRFYDGGKEELISETIEERINGTVSKTPVNSAGTHLENSCKAARTFDSNLNSGFYTVNKDNNIKVYCDMETSGGGWTVVQKETGQGINEALYTDHPLNESNPSTSSGYRLSRANMTFIQSVSTEMRVDCRGTDHLETSSINLFNGEGRSNNCNNNNDVFYTSASLKGYNKTNIVMCTWNNGLGAGEGKYCAGAFHIDETAQSSYGCGNGSGLPNYQWAGTPIVRASADTFALYAGTKDATTDCHALGAERYIMLR